jgi:hypothetical protein
VTVAAWALVPVPALAASDPEGRASAETPAEKTLKALNQTLTFDFNEQPLETVLERIREQTKLKLVSDFLTFEQMGLVDEGTMVTVKLEKAKVRTGLQTVLTPFNLTYVVLGDTVLITTEEVASQRQVRQRISVDFESTPLQTALRQLARQTAANLIVDARAAKDAQNPVSLKLDDVSLEVAVQLLADMAGLRPVRVGNVLYVTTKNNATELQASLNSQNRPDRAPGAEMPVYYPTSRTVRAKIVPPPKGVPAPPPLKPALIPAPQAVPK